MADSTESTERLHQAFQSAAMNPNLIHGAIEDIRGMAGANVMATISAQIRELRVEMRAEFKAQGAQINAQGARIDAQGARIDDMQTLFNTQFKAVGDRIDAQGTRIDALRDSMDHLRKMLWPLVLGISVTLLGVASTAIYKILST